jgi:hypothetical protein
MIKQLRYSVLAVLTATALVGCATTEKSKQAKADDGEYEWVTPVGSNIAVKVRKGQRASALASPTENLSQDQLGTMQRGTGGAKPAGSN